MDAPLLGSEMRRRRSARIDLISPTHYPRALRVLFLRLSPSSLLAIPTLVRETLSQLMALIRNECSTNYQPLFEYFKLTQLNNKLLCLEASKSHNYASST